MTPHEIAYRYSTNGDPMLQATYQSIALTLEKAHGNLYFFTSTKNIALHTWLGNHNMEKYAPYLIENKLWIHKLCQMKHEEFEALELPPDIIQKLLRILSMLPGIKEF